ncbi:GumC family protein [Bacteroides fragilis]|uniref:GumC family protein n=1 Tax=Bacteroides fragilis TaxID=817 RepID=UPI001EF04336|nr:Wzz/FepE/Etk N-terminal domain-containing protein [Bacteroides fragilis]
MENEQKQQEQEIDLIELFYKVIVHWRWFLIAIAVALTGAYIYVHITTPVYQASASVVIKDSEGSDKAINDLFNQVSPSNMAATNTQIEDELEILRSRSILLQVINELNMHTSYRIKEGLGYTETTTPPISVTLEKAAMDTLQEALLIQIEKMGDHYEARSALHDICLTESFTTFPATIKTLAGLCTLELLSNRTFDRTVKVNICRPTDAVNHYLQKLTVATTSKKTSIISLTFKDTDKKRAEAFLIKLIEVYNRDAMNDKNKVTGNTLIFLEERLDSISRELGFVEKHLEQYKEKERLIDLKTNMDLDLNTNNEYEKKLLEVETQLNMTTYIYDYLKDEQYHFSLLPVNTGISDMELMRLINEYNKELLERERLLNTMKPDNPTIVNQNINITALRKNILSSVTGVKEGLEIARKDIIRKTNYFNSRIGNMPKQEREFNNIDRQQQIKANLYLMLLERREQATISLAATINKARVIDAPLTADAPIAPKSPMIYAGSLFMACIMTIALILFKDMFRTKISSISEVEAIQLPIVGTIPLDKEQIGVTEGKNGLMEESFHRLRSNLRFLTEKGDEKCILITSSTSGEGKSFISINLALSFAFLGCRVLIVGLDIRRPRLAEHFHIQNRQGITNFLAGNEVKPESIIYPSGVHELLSVVPSGPVPPIRQNCWKGKD